MTRRGAAFGLCVNADPAFPDLDALAGGPTDRPVEIRLGEPHQLTEAVAHVKATCLLDRRFPNGRQMLKVIDHNGIGYSVAAPRHGRHLISPDGRRVRSAIPRVSALQWQRLFFAQVLPLAATLQGLEVMHASAVTIDGRAIAFVAASGAGKTSLAINLAARGAEILTDDVLAVDATGACAVAYAGARLISAARHEYAALDRASQRRVGMVLGRTDKVHIRPQPCRPSADLAGICFLQRDPDRTGTVEIRPCTAADQPLLLGALFIGYLTHPQHLLSHLDAAAHVASTTPTFVIDVPAGREAAEVAAAVIKHVQPKLQ